MRLLTVRENERIPIGHGTRALSASEAGGLGKLAPRLPAGTFTWEHRSLRFGSYCGVLRAGDLTIEVLPKIGADRANDDEARGILVAMLRSSGDLASVPDNPVELGKQTLHLLDVFIIDFCSNVTALLRRGAIRSYRSFDGDLAAVRGRIRLDEQLRRGVRDRSRLHCRFDELSIDNPHNRALKSVIQKLFLSAVSSDAKRATNSLLRRFADVSEVTSTPDDVERLAFNRLTEIWRPAFRRAALLLRGLYPDVRAGDVDGSCLLFDMGRLFENYVGKKLRAAWCCADGGGVSVVLQGPQKHLALSSNRPAFRLRPDASLVSRAGVVQRIVDAKWKILDPTGKNLGVAREDAYQLSAYAGRYSCSVVTLIYPRAAGLLAGLLESFDLHLAGAPKLEVYAVDLVALAKGGRLPDGLRPLAPGL